MSYNAEDLIVVKRDGGSLTASQIEWLVSAYTEDEIPDYQMAALAMAILLNGMDTAELTILTSAMLRSGEVMDFSDLAFPKVDKHSTGGVGDKISIPLAPMVASCGVAVPMMSGRGLAHTGGTLDKLESIPGYTTEFDAARFRSLLIEHGLVMAGQSADIAPADKKLYALRDVTGTVPSIPLIAASIMSKKLAEGLDGLVLDVKTGSGAAIKDLAKSRELAKTMVDIGAGSGVETVALITSMEQPLGAEVGNANEIVESLAVLRGEGPPDVTELTMALGEVMLELAGIDGGRSRLEEAISSGDATKKFAEIIAAQGGDPSVVDDSSILPTAPLEDSIVAPRSGFVTRCDALTIGVATTNLGAGRVSLGGVVDPGVGVSVLAKIGDRVSEGDTLARVRYSKENLWEDNRSQMASAWNISSTHVAPPSLIVDRID
ncbi:MAG: thymidine phosphorylase [Acidimicrobiia bacterium]|nr:thymidine phosphorylase [Acidimicrobiia bacterium]